MEEMTQEQIMAEIAACKILLRDTDYQCQKHSEGWITEEDYAPIKAKRQEWRNTINSLEALLEPEDAPASGDSSNTPDNTTDVAEG